MSMATVRSEWDFGSESVPTLDVSSFVFGCCLPLTTACLLGRCVLRKTFALDSRRTASHRISFYGGENRKGLQQIEPCDAFLFLLL